MSTTRPALEIWPDLRTLGRHTLDGTEYVVYDDGAYRCAIAADDWDDVPERAAEWWLDRLPHARRLVPEGDPAAMLEGGADVRAWIEAAT